MRVTCGNEDRGRGVAAQTRPPRYPEAVPATDKEIAAKLCVSIRTVESHRTHIMHKMNFSNLSDLVRFAIKTHLVAL